jgi:voltage-gated potassium channel
VSHHRIALIVIAAAVVLDAVLGVAFAAAEHVSVLLGWYWAVTTATTVGYGDVVPHTVAGHVIAVAVMLTVVPLFAATFSLFTSALGATHVRHAVARLRKDADGRHVLLQQHVERVVKGHCADLKAHVSLVVAGRPVSGGAGDNPALSEGLPADEPVVPPPAATRRRKPRP